MGEMTSRDRVRSALQHVEPDRLPVEFGGIWTTFHKDSHRALMRHLGLEGGEEQVRSLHTNLVEPDPRIIRILGRDTLTFSPNPGGGWELHVDPQTDTWVDEWGIKYRKPPGGYWYDYCAHPLAEAKTAADLDRVRWPDPADPARIKGLPEAMKAADEKGEKAIVLCTPILGSWTEAWYLRGLEQAMEDLALNQDLAEELAERTTRWLIAFWDSALAQLGRYMDVVALEGDLGVQEGPLFSPEVWRRIYKPRLARLISAIKAKTRAKILLHSCGSVYWALSDLVEVGIEVLNPVQLNARNMGDTARLKREFGKYLTFWGGGCDPVVFHLGTSREVTEEVRRRILDLGPGGGFVFGPVHGIQANCPPENVLAMAKTTQENGMYPLRA
jgi:uroporphyrinogen decarboxylase